LWIRGLKRRKRNKDGEDGQDWVHRGEEKEKRRYTAQITQRE
jgi:hypothetical protein